MKKQTFFILSLASLLLFACNTKTLNKTATTETPDIETPKEEKEQEEEPKAEPSKPYVLASIKKTPCYGKCPVFEANFYNDGRAEYFGKMNVKKMGSYASRIDDSTLKSIRSKAGEVGYFDLYNTYPTGEVKIADLPTTITSVRIGDMIKTVSNKYQGPEELKIFEDFLLEIVDRLEWTKTLENSKK